MNNFTFYKDEQGREEFELAFMRISCFITAN